MNMASLLCEFEDEGLICKIESKFATYHTSMAFLQCGCEGEELIC